MPEIKGHMPFSALVINSIGSTFGLLAMQLIFVYLLQGN
jgi:hypothetical protein